MRTLLSNNRFYILSFSIFLSLFIFAWLRLQISDDQLLIIRSQQIYGLTAMIYLYIALAISPISSIVGGGRIKQLIFSRRAIGVSAFYFGLLHSVIAFWGQLGGFSNVELLPTLFIWSLIGGTIALVVMFAMTVTSTDGFIKAMSYRKWKWLHRSIYIGGILILLHVWSLGTHMVSPAIQLIFLAALALLTALEVFRALQFLNKKYQIFSKEEAMVTGIAAWAIVVTLIVITPSIVPNYHSRHTDKSDDKTSSDIHKMMGH